jgi:hypothetical protein
VFCRAAHVLDDLQSVQGDLVAVRLLADLPGDDDRVSADESLAKVLA